MKTHTNSSVLFIIIYLFIFLLINKYFITKIQKKEKGKIKERKEGLVLFKVTLLLSNSTLTTGWKWGGNDLQQKKT